MAGASQGFRRVAAEAGAGASDQDDLGHDLVPSSLMRRLRRSPR